MSYITKQEALDFLQKETNAFIDTGFSSWLSSVEAFIEKYTGRTFEKVTAETRYFDGSGQRTLLLPYDDLLAVTSLKILNLDGSELSSLTEGASNDYLLYPLNEANKCEVRLAIGSSVGAFYSGSKRVEIVGDWGNAQTVPDDIKQAAKIMVGEIIKSGADGGDIKDISLGDYKVSYLKNSEVKNLAVNSGAIAILDNYIIYQV